MRDPAFFEQPLCAETDPDVFFPENGVIASTPKKICRACDHLQECLIWALHHQVDGVWGATTPKERQRIRAVSGIKSRPFYKSGQFITAIDMKERGHER